MKSYNQVQKDLNTLYPVMDYVPRKDWKTLGFDDSPGFPLPSVGMYVRNIHAKWTGEKRPPKSGEWYLSGSCVEAYRAPKDLSTPYHIATLVATVTVTETKIVEIKNVY